MCSVLLNADSAFQKEIVSLQVNGKVREHYDEQDE